jgi:tetrahydromethanopterin S-methyltransferase subunit G
MNKHLVETLRILKEQFNIQEELPPSDDEDELDVTSIPTEHPMLGEYCDDDLEEEQGNTTSAYAGGEGPQRTPYAFGKSKKKRSAAEVYDDPVEESNKWFVKLEHIYEKSQKRINELNYQEFKTDDSQTSRQKINSSIKEINSKLSEVERMIAHSQKFKNEIGADSGVFYKDTINKFQKISERLMRISSKIREFNT